MSNRYTIEDVRARINTLHRVATAAGLSVLNYHGSTTESLYVIRSSGVLWLKGEAGDTGGAVDICRPGTARELCQYLQGLIDGIELNRFND